MREDAQGQGLGQRLLEHAHGRARSAACRTIHLDVYADNPAVALYLRNGFRLVVETDFPGKPGLPSHYRMVKDLEEI